DVETIERWAEEGIIPMERLPSGRRRIDRRDVVKVIRERGLRIANPDLLGLPDLQKLEAQYLGNAETDDELQHAIVIGDAERARGLTLSMYLAGRSVHELCDGPMATALHEAGGLWQHTRHGIHLEHRATDVCIQAIELLRWLVPLPEPGEAPVAVGGAVPGDPYIVPSLMVAVVLAAHGWREVNLGPDLPLESLTAAVEHHQPRLIWLSMSVTGLPAELPGKVASLARQLHEQGRTLVVGGRVWQPLDEDVPGLRSAASMAELVAIQREILAG
ncbi:MAG: cobalamin B12-binding domain-containing protein, partial [Phycisphaeraceae bacterium]